jgi:hypothetical protein
LIEFALANNSGQCGNCKARNSNVFGEDPMMNAVSKFAKELSG